MLELDTKHFFRDVQVNIFTALLEFTVIDLKTVFIRQLSLKFEVFSPLQKSDRSQGLSICRLDSPEGFGSPNMWVSRTHTLTGALNTCMHG